MKQYSKEWKSTVGIQGRSKAHDNGEPNLQVARVTVKADQELEGSSALGGNGFPILLENSVWRGKGLMTFLPETTHQGGRHLSVS